jgi:hypothetical protein
VVELVLAADDGLARPRADERGALVDEEIDAVALPVERQPVVGPLREERVDVAARSRRPTPAP